MKAGQKEIENENECGAGGSRGARGMSRMWPGVGVRGEREQGAIETDR
jgi:hypothetical protein